LLLPACSVGTFPGMDEPKKSPVPALVITAAVVGSLSGALYWWKHQPPAAEPPATEQPPAEAAPAAEGSPTPPPEAAPAPPEKAALPPPLRSFTVQVRGPLESAI